MKYFFKTQYQVFIIEKARQKLITIINDGCENIKVTQIDKNSLSMKFNAIKPAEYIDFEYTFEI